MIEYYNGEQLLGYAVGMCPKTGKPVVVNDNLEYFTPDVITHKIIGDTSFDPRTSGSRIEKCFEPVTTTPHNYKTPTL